MLNISIVIPVYNEASQIKKTLNKVIKYLSENNYEYELIVVDDGSTDNTIEVISEIKNIKILKNNINRGKGYSVKKGILEAKNEWLLFSDADLSTPIEELKNFLNYLNYDIIIGSRDLRDSNIKIPQPFYRKLSGRIFNLFVRLLLLKEIKDTQCGFKLFRKEIAHKLFSKQTIERFSFDVEILWLAQKYGYKIKELPVTWINVRDTRVHFFKDGIRMLKDIIKIKINEQKGVYQ